MRNVICMLLCGAGVAYLTASDAFINMSASSVIGSSPESMKSARYVAVGVTIGLLALGSIASVLKCKISQGGLWAITSLAALFSAVLTVQAVSVDYAANDHSGSIQSERRRANNNKIDQYQDELERLNRKMKECERDRYFAPCRLTERRIAALSDRIAEASDDNVLSKRAQKVDITEAVEEKAGIPGIWLERAGIYTRALAVPFMISILMMGFWAFWGQIWGDYRLKKPKKVGRSELSGTGTTSGTVVTGTKKAQKREPKVEPSTEKSGSAQEAKPKKKAQKTQAKAEEGRPRISRDDKKRIQQAMYELAVKGEKITVTAVQKMVGIRRQKVAAIVKECKEQILINAEKAKPGLRLVKAS